MLYTNYIIGGLIMFLKFGDAIQSYNPANKELLGTIKCTTDSEISEIVAHCREAFSIWSSYSYNERGKRLRKLADILESKANEFATLMTKEMGRPLSESLPEVTKSVKFIRSFSDKAESMLSNFIINDVPSKDVKIINEPYGVGGKDPMIVLDDADINFAAMAAVWGSTTNCGQFCSSIERVYVQDTIFDKFVIKAKEYCEKIKVGNGLDPTVEMGPVVNESQYNKVIGQIQDAIQRGATVVTGGGGYESGELANGWFIQPTIIINLTNDMKIVRES